jgi:hypothetical protein
LTVIPRLVYKRIEGHFFNRKQLREHLTDWEDATRDTARNDIYDDNCGHGVGRHADPTAMAAIAVIEGGPKEMRNVRDWLWVVDNVKKRYEGTEHGTLIELYYEQGLPWREVAEQMKKPTSVFYAMREEIITTAYAAAAQKNLIKVF